MSFSYNLELTDDVSKIRLLIQDNIEIGRFLEDEEILFFLSTSGSNLYKAASDCAFSLYSRFMQELTVVEIDDMRIETKDRVKYYKTLYDDLKRKAATQNGKIPPIFIGGTDRKTFVAQSEGLSVDNYKSNFFDV